MHYPRIPKGARKVPGLKVWMAEDGTPYGVTGALTPSCRGKAKTPVLTALTDEGRKRTSSTTVARMVAATWLPPQPPNTKLVHVNGDKMDNRACNLEWRRTMTGEERRRKYATSLLERLLADPDERRHGTKTAYDVGCRCQRCSNASRTRKKYNETRKLISELEGICGKRTSNRS